MFYDQGKQVNFKKNLHPKFKTNLLQYKKSRSQCIACCLLWWLRLSPKKEPQIWEVQWKQQRCVRIHSPAQHGNTTLTQREASVTAGRADNTQLVAAICPCTAQLHTAPSCYSPRTNFLHQHLHTPFDAALCHHEKGAAFSSLQTQLQSHSSLQGSQQTFSETFTLV